MNERIIDKIKRLIRCERSIRKTVGTSGLYGTSTAEEAATFAATIQRLCINHKIEPAQLHLDDETAQAKIDHEEYATSRTKRCGYGARITGEDSHLMHVVSRAHFCQAIGMPRTNCILIIGEEQDRAVCVEMFQYLRRAMRVAAIIEEEAQHKRRRTVRRFKYWFCLGFVQIIEKRYRELRAQADATSTALVKADALVKQYVAENFETKTARGYHAPGRMNLEAALAGMRTAHSVDLKTNVMAGG